MFLNMLFLSAGATESNGLDNNKRKNLHMSENKLRELLKQKKISIRKCAEDTGISYRTLIRYLRGEDGRLENYRVLAAYLGVSLLDLVGDTKPRPKTE